MPPTLVKMILLMSHMNISRVAAVDAQAIWARYTPQGQVEVFASKSAQNSGPRRPIMPYGMVSSSVATTAKEVMKASILSLVTSFPKTSRRTGLSAHQALTAPTTQFGPGVVLAATTSPSPRPTVEAPLLVDMVLLTTAVPMKGKEQ